MSKINNYNLPYSEIQASQKFDADNRLVISKTEIGVTSSSTSMTALYNIFIPANTFIANDILELKTVVSKTGTVGGATIRFYWNETADLTTATQLGTVTYPTTINGSPAVIFPMFRRLAISVAVGTGRGTVLFRTTTSTANDIYFNVSDPDNYYSTGGIENLAIDWTIDGYILVAGSVTSTSDYIQCKYMKLNN
jgi:hypothetical protein